MRPGAALYSLTGSRTTERGRCPDPHAEAPLPSGMPPPAAPQRVAGYALRPDDGSWIWGSRKELLMGVHCEALLLHVWRCGLLERWKGVRFGDGRKIGICMGV